MLTWLGLSSSRSNSPLIRIDCSASITSQGGESRLRGARLSYLCSKLLGVELFPTLGTNNLELNMWAAQDGWQSVD